VLQSPEWKLLPMMPVLYPTCLKKDQSFDMFQLISRLGYGRPCVQRWLWPFPKAAEGEAAE